MRVPAEAPWAKDSNDPERGFLIPWQEAIQFAARVGAGGIFLVRGGENDFPMMPRTAKSQEDSGTVILIKKKV